MARIACIRKKLRIELSLLLVASCFTTGCAQGPKAFFANAWSSSRDGVSNLAQKVSPPWKEKKSDDSAIASKDDNDDAVKTVSMEESKDESGSIFSAWIRNGSEHENKTADPFLNQSWVRNIKKESAREKNSNKIINVSSETRNNDPLVINKDSKSGKTLSEYDKLIASISTDDSSPEETDESIQKNEFVQGLDSNLDKLRASLKKDKESNDQLIIPDLQNNESKELVEKKMILAETFLTKGDVKSARKSALEAEKIAKKENLDIEDNSPSEFLDRIAAAQSDELKSSKSSDELALNNSFDKKVKKKSKKSSHFDLAFPNDPSTSGWKSDDDFSGNSLEEEKTDSGLFNNFNDTAKADNSDTSMIVDTEELPERNNIRENFRKSRKGKKKTSSEYPKDDWDTSATEKKTREAEKVVQLTRPKKQIHRNQEVKANAHSQITLASHEKNVLAPMGNMKVRNIITPEPVEEEIVFLYGNGKEFNHSSEIIALAPVKGSFPEIEEEINRRGGSLLIYPAIAGLLFFACASIYYLKRRRPSKLAMK